MQRTTREETVRNHGVSRFAKLLTMPMVSNFAKRRVAGLACPCTVEGTPSRCR
jgi:hypothetical protein